MKKLIILFLMFVSNSYAGDTFTNVSIDWSLDATATVDLKENGVFKVSEMKSVYHPPSLFEHGHTEGYVPLPNYPSWHKSYNNSNGTHYVNAAGSSFVYSSPIIVNTTTSSIMAGTICSVGHTINGGAPLITTHAFASPSSYISRVYNANSDLYVVKSTMQVSGTLTPEAADSTGSTLFAKVTRGSSNVTAHYDPNPNPRWKIDWKIRSSTGQVTQGVDYVSGLTFQKSYQTYEMGDGPMFGGSCQIATAALDEDGISTGYSGADPSSSIEMEIQAYLNIDELIDLE